MADKFTASYSQLRPDQRYGSVLLSKFVNCLMHDGKKSIAQRHLYNALDMIQKRIPDQEPINVFHAAVDNVKPAIEVRSKRVGGATYQVPTPVPYRRQQTLAIRWILQAVRGKKGRPISARLADELVAAFKREGTAMTTRDNVHRMADANKAFAHFAYSR
ncbi:MAG: 30S ribosomal protein S7 [Planctomycetaceae bacterium]